MYKLTAAVAAALTLVGHVAFANVVVTPTNPGGWVFSDLDNTPSGTDVGQFVAGPGTPPLGIGSANLQVGATNSSEILINGGIKPVLNNTFAAGYQTFVTSSAPGSGAAPTLQIDLFKGLTYFGRMVFDPGLLASGTVVDGQWQAWDTGSSSAWYLSRSALFSGQCAMGSPCSLAAIEGAVNSQSGVIPTDVLFKAGSGQSNFNGNVDDLTLTIGDTTTTYDFEPDAVPEPASLAVLGVGVLGLARVRSRKTARTVSI